MKFDPNKTSQSRRIRDMGDVIGNNPDSKEPKKKMSTPRKATLVGAATLAAAFSGTIVRSGADAVKKVAPVVSPSSDRAYNPAQGNPNTVNLTKSKPEAAGVSKELQEQIHAKFEQMQMDQTTPRNSYVMHEGDSPAGIVEGMLVVNGTDTVGVTDTVAHGADVEFIKVQAAKYGGMLHSGDTVVLPPGTDVPGQTTPVELPGQ